MRKVVPYGGMSPRRWRLGRRPSGLSVVIWGVAIGAAMGLLLIPEMDHPGSFDRLVSESNPIKLAAARKAEHDARVPPGGFRSCAQAQAAGFGVLYIGEKAYSSRLDKDGDGQACEWNSRGPF